MHVRLRNLAGVLLRELEPESLEHLRLEAATSLEVRPELVRLVLDGQPLDFGALVEGTELLALVDPTACYRWELEQNPDQVYLRAVGASVEMREGFPIPDYVNVLTQVPIERGRHYVEFLMHAVHDEQWCGVTMSKERAGACGEAVKGFYYYSGRRSHPCGHLDALSERKHVMQFEHVQSGDVIGLLVDFDQQAIVFTLNGRLQGGCGMPPVPLYFCTALDEQGDAVELVRRPVEDFPYELKEVMASGLFVREVDEDTRLPQVVPRLADNPWSLPDA